MDIKAYIESGVIECFVLGVATEQEAKEVLALAEKHPEIKAALDANRGALENYISYFSRTPHPENKSKLLSALMPNKSVADEDGDMLERLEIRPFYRVWWVAASLVLLSFSLLYNVYLSQVVKDKEAAIVQLEAGNKKMVLENMIHRANYRNASEQLALLHKHGNKTTHLEGMPIAKDASAMVYWNSENKDVFVAVDFLPKPPEGKQYQLWALVNGKPVDAGVLDLYASDKSLQKMKKIETAQAFAISLENLGGSATPTMEAIYLMGSI